MKKTVVFYHKRLQQLMKDEEFRNTPMLDYALALINHLILMGVSGCFVKPQFPVISPSECMGLFNPTKNELAILANSFDSMARLEAKIYPGPADCCLGIEIRAYKKGPDKTPLFFILGGVDSDGARKLAIAQHDPSMESFRK